MEGTNLSWDELTCVGYEVTDSAVEKLCKDMKAFLQDAFIKHAPEEGDNKKRVYILMK